MGTYTKNLKLETPSYTDNADIPALTKKNNEIIDSEMIKRANGLDYNEQTGVLQLTGNNSKVGSPIQIKNNLPVTSMANGTELKVNNYKQLIKFTKEGKTEQKSYTGKNILDYVSNLKASSDGLTNVINDDGSITTSGKPTGNYRTIINEINITDILEDGQTYTISQNIASDKLYAQVGATKKTGEISYFSCALGKGKYSFKVDKTIYENYSLKIQTGTISTWGDKSLTITNKYMLCKGTDTADSSFEPYVGGTQSPNPDYPQEIKNISGIENLLNIPDGTYESNGITAIAKGGVVTLNGTATANSFINIPFNYTFLANINYTLSANNTLTMGGENYIRFNYGTTVYFPCRFFYEKSKFTNNFNENTIVNAFTIRTESGKTYNNFVIKPQLEKGQIAHNFVPNGSNYLQLKNTTDNKEKIINVDLKGNNLCSDRDKTIKDDLIIENGKAKINKKIKEVVLTGNENIVSDGKTSNYYRYKIGINSETFLNYPTALCTHFIYNSSYAADVSHFYVLKTGEMLFFSDKSTLDEFKNLLKVQYDAGTPVIIQYELAEPEVIDLGKVDFDLIENSTLTCEEESDMQIDYLTIDSNIFVQDSLDGSSSQKAPSVDAIKKYFGKKVYDKDANGWIKIEFFDHTEYVTEGQITQIDFSTGWGVSKLLSLPVGMSTIGDRILSGNVRTFDAAISVNISGILTERQITYNWKNNHSSNVTTGLNYSLRILEYV